MLLLFENISIKEFLFIQIALIRINSHIHLNELKFVNYDHLTGLSKSSGMNIAAAAAAVIGIIIGTE